MLQIKIGQEGSTVFLLVSSVNNILSSAAYLEKSRHGKDARFAKSLLGF
jgi:hypothetical protein